MLRHNQNKQSLSDQAIYWFVRLNSGDGGEIDTREFERWLVTSHAHRRAFEHVEEMWQKMDGLNTASFPELDKAMACWERRDFSAKEAKPANLFSSFRFQLVMAAMVVVIIAGAWFWKSFQAVSTSYRTAPGKQKTITLADGSMIEMNTNTFLTVKMSAKSRKVILAGGEAFFTVAHEKKRPFEVQAGTGTIRALGTCFNVQRSTKLRQQHHKFLKYKKIILQAILNRKCAFSSFKKATTSNY